MNKESAPETVGARNSRRPKQSAPSTLTHNSTRHSRRVHTTTPSHPARLPFRLPPLPMPRRRQWRPIPRAPTDKEKPGTDAVGTLGLVAPVRNVADIVDAFASVNFINSSVQATTTDDLLRAVEVVRVGRGPCAENCVVFRTASEAFPLKDTPHGSPFGVVGSNYRFFVIDAEMEQGAYRFTCDWASVSSLAKIQASAARVAGKLINESIDGDSQIFHDAVSSRVLFFTRIKTGVMVEEPEHYPPLPAMLRPALSGVAVTPFERPQFNTLDDLLASFATHAVRSKGGEAYTVGPTECPPPLLRQPLVFCPTLAVVKILDVDVHPGRAVLNFD